MKKLFVVSAILAIFAASGCGINTITKEKTVSTGLFGGNLPKMDLAFKGIQSKIASGVKKEDLKKAGFDYEAGNNIQCFRGPEAMQYVVGDNKSTIDLSTAEKIESYAKAANAYEACIFPEQRLKSEKPRFFFSTREEKERGPEIVYIFIFKDGLLFNARDTRRQVLKREKEKSFGGNVLESALGAGISAGRRFW